MSDSSRERLIEELADLAHIVWAEWMRYMLSRRHGTASALEDPDVKHTILPADLVDRWSRQMTTPYADLPEEEKESDRAIARRYLQVMLLHQGRQRMAKLAARSKDRVRQNSPVPRYDDVYFDGMKWLDSLAGDDDEG